MGLGGVTVRLSGMGDGETTTDDTGQYAFTGLRSGTYSVEISGFDAGEVGFSSTSGAATVGVGESKVVSFDGTYLRTAGIQGQVSVEGEGLGGVTVTLVGEGEDRSETTNASGQYAFSKLKSGTYQVAISGFDPDDYEFQTTSKTATVATGETTNVPFEGTLLRTAGIAGRVSVEGMGLDDVTVTLAGAEDRTTTTSNGGQYSFAGLAAGTYVVSIANPDPVAYDFAEEDMTENVTLTDDQSAIVNFSGTHTRNASVTGMLFIDEAPQDKMYTANEPPLVNPDPTAPGMPLLLQGPGINDVTPGMAMADGTFAFEGLVAGSYRVLVNMTEEVAAGLAAAGFEFVGDLTGALVNVAAGMEEQVNFPFRITTQTITVGAVMGTEEEVGDPINGVMLSLYPTAEDAEDGTNMLGEAMATAGEGPAAGMAMFHFPRAMDSSPGSDDTDNLVFVKVDDLGSEDLVVTDNSIIEIEYPGVARVHAAPAHVRVLNNSVNIQFWIKSDADARGGDEGLEGWAYEYCMPMADDPATMDVDETNTCMPGEDDTPAVFTPVMDADGDAMVTDAEGKGTLKFKADPKSLPAIVYIRAAGDQDDKIDMDEKFVQTDALMHEHNGLILPANNDPAKNMEELDKGPVYVTFTTQSLTVGVHRELDDRIGFSKYRGIGGGDARPDGQGVGKVEVRLLMENAAGRPRPYMYDHDLDPKTPDVEAEAEVDATGVVTFAHVPAEDQVIVEVDAGTGVITVPTGRDDREINAYGDGLDEMAGVVEGAFGAASGAQPDVWLCPLGDSADDCSTFAYKWNDGTITGTVGGLKRGDTDVVVSLVPVSTPYADDLEDDAKVAWNSTRYTFTNVADGSYRVRLESVAGKWEADSTAVIDVVHNVNPRGDDSGAMTIDANAEEYGGLSATSLRSGIRGTVGNDASENGSLSRSEAIAGVKLELYNAVLIDDDASDDDGKYMVGAAVEDESGNTMTATTNSDGFYEFAKLVDQKKYFVKAMNTADYSVVRNRGATEAGDAGDVVSMALATAAAITGTYTEPVPTWNYLSSVASGVGASHFVLLHHDGTAEGDATDPSTRRRHADTYIELQRCLTVEDNEVPDPGVAPTEAEMGIQPGDECDVEADEDPIEVPVMNTRSNTGAWEVTGLKEGVYGVEVDLPSGYELVNATGGATDAVERFLIIVQGSRDDAAMLTYDETSGEVETDEIPDFWLKRRNAGNTATLAATNPVVADDETCAADAVCVHTDESPIGLTVTTAEDDANIRLSPSPTSRTATGSFNVTSGDEASVPMLPGQFRSYHIHLRADDGYTAGTTSGPYHFRRDADVRLDTLVVSYRDDNGATRIAYDRVDLNLNPDGEVAPVVGRTDLGKYIIDDAGDGTAALEINLIVRAMQRAYGVPTFQYISGTSGGTAPGACPTGDVSGNTDNNLAADPATATDGAAQTRVCFDILDDNTASGANALDTNEENKRRYQILFERKRTPSS